MHKQTVPQGSGDTPSVLHKAVGLYAVVREREKAGHQCFSYLLFHWVFSRLQTRTVHNNRSSILRHNHDAYRSIRSADLTNDPQSTALIYNGVVLYASWYVTQMTINSHGRFGQTPGHCFRLSRDTLSVVM